MSDVLPAWPLGLVLAPGQWVASIYPRGFGIGWEYWEVRLLWWCRGPESNWLRLPFQGSALPMSYPGNIWPFNSRVGRKKSQTGSAPHAPRWTSGRTAPGISESALRPSSRGAAG